MNPLLMLAISILSCVVVLYFIYTIFQYRLLKLKNKQAETLIDKNNIHEISLFEKKKEYED